MITPPPSPVVPLERTGVVLTLGHAQVPRPHFARSTPYTVDRGLEAVGQPTAAADHGREGGRGLKAVLVCVCVTLCVCVCVCVCACQAELDPEALVPLSQLVDLENSHTWCSGWWGRVPAEFFNSYHIQHTCVPLFIAT